MKRSLDTVGLAICAVLIPLGLATGAPAEAARVTTRWSHVEEAPGFAGWREQFQHMVDQDGRSRINHFCVVVAARPVGPPDGVDTWAYVHWREKAVLYTFAPAADGKMSDESIFKLPLNLKTDVKASPGSSTYQVAPAWLHDVLQHCVTSGTRVVVSKSRG